MRKNDLTRFDEGKSHSENPLGGIPIGGDNTVEQNETKIGDFVYSDRITLTPEIIKQYNLPKSLGNKTVADATKFIDSKFKDRNDKISLSTKDGMLAKIAEAQESLKPIDNLGTLGQNQMFLGGLTESTGSPYMSAVEPGMGLINGLATGNEDQSLTSGIKLGTTVAGTAIGGPIGGMIGGMVGDLAGGLINGNKERKAAQDLAKKNHLISSNQFTNDFALGGKLPIDGLDFQKWVNRNKYGTLVEDGIIGKNSLPLYQKYGNQYNNELLNSIDPSTNIDLRRADANRTPAVQFGSAFRSNPTIQSDLAITEGINPDFNGFVAPTTPEGYPKADLSKIGNVLGQAARYAPIAMNAYQLSQLEKPEYSRLNRLDQRFNPEYVDERSLQNIVSNETNNTINSLSGATNGSTGALRSNILGAGLNRTKALSDAYINAEAQNRATNVQGQQFNAGINATNLQQDNLELDINDRNEAAYRNERSKYLAEIGNGIGDIGKEEIYKRIAKTTTGYNWLGEYQKINPNATQEEIEAAAKKAGVLTDSKPNALGGYLFKNKGK